MPTSLYRLCRKIGTTNPIHSSLGLSDDGAINGSITDTDVAEVATNGTKGLGYLPPPYGPRSFKFLTSEPGTPSTTFAF